MRRKARSGVADPDGYLLLRKRPGISSFDALNLVKKALDTGRVGHSGTLDKFAEGLLVVLAGRSTRLVPWFTGCDKIYDGDIRFGSETDTLDPEGSIIAEAPAPAEAALREVLPTFTGPIMQAPPLYSSVHVNGMRAHQLARAGAEVEMKARPVTIHSLDLLSYDGTTARVRVSCSKGTYIRSLARDIALACGSRAHLTALLRTRVAGFRLADAADPLAAEDPLEALRAALRPVDSAAFAAIGVPTATLDDARIREISHGKPFDPSALGPLGGKSPVAVLRSDGRFAAILETSGDSYRYCYVSVRPEEL